MIRRPPGLTRTDQRFPYTTLFRSFNPAVTAGLCAAGRFSTSELLPYWLAQVAGAIVAAAVLFLIASGAPGFDAAGGFAANGYGAHSDRKSTRLNSSH